MTEMTPEVAAILREKFQPNQIGQLPKPYKKDSPRGNCNVCGGYHGLPAVHLDYVGHAAATDRLLKADPAWTWEPFALDANGLPALDRNGDLWIRLTVAGVTRPGVGDGNSMKEKIGDAIRNAAMRFGVAIDLWAKEDLHDSQQDLADGPSVSSGERASDVATDAPVPSRTPPPQGGPGGAVSPAKQLMADITQLSPETKSKFAARAKDMTLRIGATMSDDDVALARRLIDEIDKEF